MSGWSFGFVREMDHSEESPNHFPSPNPLSLSDPFKSTKHDPGKAQHDFGAASTRVQDLSFVNELREGSRNPTFCTKENLLNSIAYINQELELLGLPCLKFEHGECTADVYFFINRIHDLLVLLQKTTAVKEDLETKNHRLSCEASRHQSTCARLRREQGHIDRDLAQEKEKNRQISVKCKQLSNKLKAEKEELKRLTAVLQSRDIQYKHDNKKKEREVISLKEKLHQLLADKVPDRKVGMDLMNVVSSGEGRRATWKTGKAKQEEEMYQLVISSYEERHRELMLENADLRECLLSLQRELSGLLKRTGNMASAPVVELQDSLSGTSDEEGDDPSITSHRSITDLDEGYIQMPFDLVRKEIEKAFKDTCDQISDGMKRSLLQNVAKRCKHITVSKSIGYHSADEEGKVRRQSMSDLAEVDRLRKQISNYKDIIQQQEELIQQSLQSHSQSVETTFLHESQLLKEKENLSEQKKLFFEEKTAFEKERQAITDAAIRLEKERQALQEERANLFKQHLQNMSPMKENQQPKAKEDSHHQTRMLPATPVLSSATSIKESVGRSPSIDSSKNKSPVVSLVNKHSIPQELEDVSESVPSETKWERPSVPSVCLKETSGGITTSKSTMAIPVVHFTPNTSVPSPQPKPRLSRAGSTSSTAAIPSSSHASDSHSLNTFDAAASLETIRASLLRIRKSAFQQDS